MELTVKEQRYRQRKREIIDAAAKVFAKKGYHGASTKDIARVLGIQQGSLYHYITSKEEALSEVCREGVDGFVSGAKDILLAQMSTDQKIRALVANHLLPMKNRQNYVIVFNNERQHLPGQMRRRVGKSSHQYEAIIGKIFAEGINNGALRADMDALLGTRALLGLCNSATQWLSKPSEIPVDQVIRVFSDILIGGIRSR